MSLKGSTLKRHLSSSRVAALLVTACSTLSFAVGSIDAGKALFVDSGCMDCHGTPPRLSNNANSAANTPSAISAAISGVGQMRFLRFLSQSDIESIATYIGNPNLTDADCTLNWAENFGPAYFSPKAQSVTVDGRYQRFYANSKLTVAFANGKILLLDGANPGVGFVEVANILDFYTLAINSDCK